MSRVWFSDELETVAMFWRLLRRDGVTLGFTTHDRDLWFAGVLHRAAPGMVPSSIRRSGRLEPDSAEVEGALSHDAIAAEDVRAGRYDLARITIGLVDWHGGDWYAVYQGALGEISEEDGRFTAAVLSRKTELQRDEIPRTSPTCRSEFCGPGCNLSAAAHSRRARIAGCDPDANTLTFDVPIDASAYVGGRVRWLDGPMAGTSATIMSGADGQVWLAEPLPAAAPAGTRVLLKEGCDATLATCAQRFGNAINFRGEPHLPGNDFVARYAQSV